MPQPSQNVRAFVEDSYQLISAATPTVPLRGDDLSRGIQFLNELLGEYSANGLLLTIAKQVDFNIMSGQGEITMGPTDFIPTPDITTAGRLANLQNAWLTLEGVTYPLIEISTAEFFNSYKYNPLDGLPRFIIVQPETNLTRITFYPAPSEGYLVSIYGKYQLNELNSNDDMSAVPYYFIKYLRYALARDLAFYKGRASAWDNRLESIYNQLRQDMISTSKVNLDVNSARRGYLNGAWAVRAGI